ncbi:MAG: nucleotidyltransferase family protein [Candidatus Aenigmarchaeota archaeon]|nr:nucleotidyltransferase family protein [Candidatus Aenigmarchaeota archaeon]
MKCIILAGGYAKRLWPITLTQSKALLRVGHKPVIEYIIDNIDKTNVNEIIISTNQKFEKDFSQWIDKNSGKFKKPIRLFVEPTTAEENKFGAVKGISYIMDEMKIEEDCMVIAGDNLFDFDLNNFLKFFHEKRGFVVAVYNVESKDKAKLYGVINVDDKERVTQFIEKPSVPASTLISTACYVFPKETFYLVSEFLKQENMADALGQFLQWVHKRIPVYAYSFDGYWFDIGDKEVLKKAEEWVRKVGVE